MREVFILLFGRKGENIYSVNIDGVEWFPAVQICKLIGARDVSSAMRQRNIWLELYDGEDKCKMKDNNINCHSEVWFVSKSGFWKLMAISNGIRALRFREWVATEFLPSILQELAINARTAERGYPILF
jgi:prophage antirepressor-like protein